MVDSSWDGIASPAAARRFPSWLGWLLAVLLLPVGLALLLGGQSAANRRRVWPALREVARRLETDEGGRALFRSNPEMVSLYGSEEAFLERVRRSRPALAALPAAEPGEARGAYRADGNPAGLEGALALADATWFGINVAAPAPFGLAGPERAQVLLADSQGELRSLARRPWEAAAAGRWQDFRSVAAALGSDPETRRLLEANPGLRRRYPDPEALLVQARRWRQAGIVLPESAKEAKGQVQISSHQGFGARVERLRFRTPDRRGLSLTWQDGRLTEVLVSTGQAGPG
jgi:hypothetical protein